MNSYFASVEQQANPLLRGRPVGVCEHLGGIIIAPSVEAKRLGIRLGTPVWEALKIFPQIVLLHTDPDKYRSITAKFMKILHDYSDDVEQYSIDEAFVDITETCLGDFSEALLLGLEIKQRLRLGVGEWISSSIGIGPNKLVAKIAADLGEGDVNRIFAVRPYEVKDLYQRLKLTDVPGIGPRLERALNKLGIFSLRALADYPLANLLNQFGVWGYVLHKLAKFEDDALVISQEDPPKSFGHAYTVPKALTKIEEIKKLMFKLSEKVGRRMRRHGASGSIVHYFHSGPSVIARNEAISFSKQRKLREFINDGKDIFRVAYKFFLQGEISNGVKIMGVSISGLKFDNNQDFLLEQYQRPLWLTKAMDKINDKYGEYTLQRAQMLTAPRQWVKDTVGFSRTRGVY